MTAYVELNREMGSLIAKQHGVPLDVGKRHLLKPLAAAEIMYNASLLLTCPLVLCSSSPLLSTLQGRYQQ